MVGHKANSTSRRGSPELDLHSSGSGQRLRVLGHVMKRGLVPCQGLEEAIMRVVGEWCITKNHLRSLLDRFLCVDPSQHYEFDSVLPTSELNALGYPRNFPHLTCMLCSIDPGLHQSFAKGERDLDSISSNGQVRLGLLPATCYKVYLERKHTDIGAPLTVGCEAKCFRFEDKALDEYRGHNFTMKEFVYLGDSEGAAKHAENGKSQVSRILNLMDIPHTFEAATDPFFDSSSSVATFSRLAPTKTEILFNGHAISSVNLHRTYFGSKLGITLRGATISTSCVAFGIERWLSMLSDVYKTPERAIQAIESAAESIG